jgi:hypothetical protein
MEIIVAVSVAGNSNVVCQCLLRHFLIHRYVGLEGNLSFQINQCRHFNQSKRCSSVPCVVSFYCSSVSEDSYCTELEELN